MPAFKFPIPDDVRRWIRDTFAGVNKSVADKITRIPTLHETSLDLSFLERLSRVAAPYAFSSGWIVRMDVHYLGGMKHWNKWEIADIGVLVMLRRRGRLERIKIGLLQSKRLYPEEQDYEEDQPIDYAIGFARLLESDERFLTITQSRLFTFSQKCRYKALIVDDDQYRAIREYELKRKIPVYYNLYHPLQIPISQQFPVTKSSPRIRKNKVGCRVVPAGVLRKAMAKQSKGYAPSYADLRFLLPAPFVEKNVQAGWPLEAWVDEVLECREGYLTDDVNDAGVFAVFAERGAPISAAFALSIDAPE